MLIAGLKQLGLQNILCLWIKPHYREQDLLFHCRQIFMIIIYHHSAFLQCSSDGGSAVPTFLLAEKIVMTLWGIYLAYSTRHVSENWNESMSRCNSWCTMWYCCIYSYNSFIANVIFRLRHFQVHRLVRPFTTVVCYVALLSRFTFWLVLHTRFWCNGCVRSLLHSSQCRLSCCSTLTGAYAACVLAITIVHMFSQAPFIHINRF